MLDFRKAEHKYQFRKALGQIGTTGSECCLAPSSFFPYQLCVIRVAGKKKKNKKRLKAILFNVAKVYYWYTLTNLSGNY